MRKLEIILSILVIIAFCFIIPKTIEAHTAPKNLTPDVPMLADEVVELKMPTYRIPEIPVVRLANFQDEFAVKPLIRNLTEEDKELLMQIAQAEAGNQDVIGRALVILTVLNRCEKTGATVSQTIYAPSQFYVKGMCKGDEKTQEAMELVLTGWDESEGCLYFCSTGWNYYGDTHLFKHQDHWFSR